MKKLIMATVMLTLVWACSKDEKMLNTEEQSDTRKDSTWSFISDYEYFESPENPGEVLGDFIDSEHNEPELYSINEAVWTLEGALNYYFRHKAFTFVDHYDADFEEELTFAEDDLIGSDDVKSLYDQIHTSVMNEIDGENIAFQVADVSVTDATGSGIEVYVRVIYAEQITWSTGSFTESANSDRHYYLTEHCDQSTAPQGGDDYIQQLAYNKLFNATSVPYYVYHYGLNVRSLSDAGLAFCTGSAYNIVGCELYNRSNDTYYPYNGTHYCMEVAEIELYRDVAEDNVDAEMTNDEIAFLVDIEDDHTLGSNALDFHRYHLVEVGEVSYETSAEQDVW